MPSNQKILLFRSPWLKYGENLGGDGWRLWCGWTTYCKLIDPWDTRTHEEVEFESLDIKNTSDVVRKLTTTSKVHNRMILVRLKLILI